MKPIPLIRFDALAGYARQPMARLMGEEASWFEHANERVLGLVIRDRADNDFAGHAFGKDRRQRYRWIGATGWYPSRRRAEVELRRELERLSALPDEEYFQGDEEGEPIDFFSTVATANRLNPSFLALRNREEYSAAFGIIEPMMRWYEDADGNFIEQFQSTGFDARIWELYLFAAFTEIGYVITRIHAIPDFCCTCPFGEFTVEAVTVNPSLDKQGNVIPPPPLETPGDIAAFSKDYMPIKFSGPLKRKLAKRYWEKPHVAGKPLLFAIQDFSMRGSMPFTRSAFERYIFGYEHEWERNENGDLVIKPKKIGVHKWGDRLVKSGFFELPDAQFISAVLFSNSGTISKFNRIGKIAGFGSPRLRLVRRGTAVNHDPQATEPIMFAHAVQSPEYTEDWAEGIDVWHNPNALHPLDSDLLPGVAHHWLLPDGNVRSLTPEWHPLGSFTLHTLVDVKDALAST